MTEIRAVDPPRLVDAPVPEETLRVADEGLENRPGRRKRVIVLGAGLAGLRDAASPDLEWTAPGLGLLVAGIGYAVLTGLALRLRRS